MNQRDRNYAQQMRAAGLCWGRVLRALPTGFLDPVQSTKYHLAKESDIFPELYLTLCKLVLTDFNVKRLGRHPHNESPWLCCLTCARALSPDLYEDLRTSKEHFFKLADNR